ncbi:MAG: hypothetical protein Kow00122_06520 [Thermoleophilia bacterium]
MAAPVVGEVCSRRYVSVPPRRRVVEVARMIAERWMPCVFVVEEGVPVGIVTKRTLIEDVLARGYTGMELTAGDIMRAPIRTIEAGAGLPEAAALMAHTSIRYLAVIEEGRLVGLLSDLHLARLLPALIGADAEPGSAARPGSV